MESIEQITNNLFFLSNKRNRLNSKVLTLRYDLTHNSLPQEKKQLYHALTYDLTRLEQNITALKDKLKKLEVIKNTILSPI